MNIVYNSNHYHVVEYPGRGGFELIDKQSGVAGFLEGDIAMAFRHSLAELIATDPTVDSVDEFLGNFDALLNQPLRYH